MELIDLWVSIEQVLTPEEFTLFGLTYGGFKQWEIAQHIGITQQAVSYRLKKIRKKLQCCL